MQNVIKEKLEALVALMNEPGVIVTEKEMREKLENIVLMLSNPEKIVKDDKEIKRKLEEILALVNNTMVVPDVDVEYCIPEVETTSQSCDVSGNPYIMLTYVLNDVEHTRKVSLGRTALESTSEDIAKHITLAIEEFKDEIDGVIMG